MPQGSRALRALAVNQMDSFGRDKPTRLCRQPSSNTHQSDHTHQDGDEAEDRIRSQRSCSLIEKREGGRRPSLRSIVLFVVKRHWRHSRRSSWTSLDAARRGKASQHIVVLPRVSLPAEDRLDDRRSGITELRRPAGEGFEGRAQAITDLCREHDADNRQSRRRHSYVHHNPHHCRKTRLSSAPLPPPFLQRRMTQLTSFRIHRIARLAPSPARVSQARSMNE